MTDHEVLTQKALQQLRLRRQYRWGYPIILASLALPPGMIWGRWVYTGPFGVSLSDSALDVWAQINWWVTGTCILSLLIAILIPLAKGVKPGSIDAIKRADPFAVKRARAVLESECRHATKGGRRTSLRG